MIMYFEKYQFEAPFYCISNNQRSNNKLSSLKRIYKFYGNIPNTNFYKQLIRTIVWSFFNTTERINSRNFIDKFSKEYLKSIFFN